MVFDGAAVATADAVAENVPDAADAADADAADAADASSNEAVGDLVEALVDPSVASGGSASSVIFVDGSVSDLEAFLQNVGANSEIVMLDGTHDGVEQIAEYMAGRTGIDEVHIIAHGEEGRLFLGNSVLDATSMRGEHVDELAVIGNGLSEQADILIYGCDFTGGDAGLEAAILLGGITGADIAASNDDTGHADFGGDWELETAVGSVEAEALEADEWHGLLAPTTSTLTYDAAASAAAGTVNGQPVIVLTDGTVTVTITNDVGASISGSTVTTNNGSGGPESIRMTATSASGTVLVSSIRFTDLDDFDRTNFVDMLALDQTGTWSNLTNANGTDALVAYTNDAAGEAAASADTGEPATFAGLRAAGAISDVILNPDAVEQFNYLGDFAFDNPVSTFRVFGSDAVLPLNQVTRFNFNTMVLTYDIPPVANNDTVSGSEDAQVTGDVEANDTDPLGDALTVTQFVVGASTVTVDPIAGGSISLAEGDLTINADGSFTFDPAANFNGSVPQVTYTISDGSLTDTATLDITINPVNDAPVAVNDTASGNEDTVVSGDVEANDTDIDGDTLTVTQFVVGASTVTVDPITGGSISLTEGDLTINADGSFTFTPAANFNGPGAAGHLHDL